MHTFRVVAGLLSIVSMLQAQITTSAVPGENPAVESKQTDPAQRGETAAQRDERMRWWREARFGLFIHWGVYAVPAGSYGGNTDYGEWIMYSARIPVAEYRGFARQFNPVKYDPAFWAQLAKDAGTRYVVITAKHHDGFALYPTQASQWSIAGATPYKKDLLGPLVEAVRKQGLKMGFYYSQDQDWNHPGGAKDLYYEPTGWDEAQKGSFDDYLAKVALPQTKELISTYHPDIFWWDTPTWMTPKRAEPFHAYVAGIPGLITNDRLGGGYKGDTSTPEQFVPATGLEGDWETCMTMNRHWGYNARDEDWKSSTELIRKLADICSKGGNFLLNVGPTAEGEIPAASIERLRDMGRWLRVNGEAIYGTTASPFPFLSWGVATRKGDRLFLHVFDWPKNGELRVPILSAVNRASLLTAPTATLPLRTDPGHVIVSVPAEAPDAANSVVVLELGAEPRVAPIPSLGKPVTASSARAGNPAEHLIDGTPGKIWTAGELKAWAEIDLGAPTEIGGYAFDEPNVWPRLKQAFQLEAQIDGKWQVIDTGKTVGHGHTQTFNPVVAQRFRLSLEREGNPPALAEWQLYSP